MRWGLAGLGQHWVDIVSVLLGRGHTGSGSGSGPTPLSSWPPGLVSIVASYAVHEVAVALLLTENAYPLPRVMRITLPTPEVLLGTTNAAGMLAKKGPPK